MYDAFGKRAMDLTVAALALLVLAPFLGVVAVLVAVKLGRPVLFRQRRGGLDSRPFDIVKFRTMTDAVDETGDLRPDADRLTPFGRTLRDLSIDELPGLWNVLKGEMSLVGPRPFIYDYVALYTPEQARRHEVRPGITGWAQVNGRNGLEWEDKFSLDVWYVDNRSLGLDLKILFLTAKKVLRRDGISSDAHVTMERFTGSAK